MSGGALIQAVILAGGLGTRMRPLTETVPKSLLAVLGRPFLDHQLELLKQNGIRRFVLLVSYLGELIEEHFGAGRDRGIQILYSYETTPLGTGGALRNAAALLDEDFLVLNGDTLLDIEYPALVKQFRDTCAPAMITAYRNIAATVSSNLEIGADGVVLRYSKKHQVGEYVDAGVLALRRSVIDLIPARTCSLEQEVFPRLIAARQMRAWRTELPFFDMGTPSGFIALENYLRQKQSA
jgi:NDP-sugar pyrophosphorylase family protein